MKFKGERNEIMIIIRRIAKQVVFLVSCKIYTDVLKPVFGLFGISVFLLTFILLSFANAAELDEIKDAIKKEGAQWVAGETSVSKLSLSERKKRLGLLTSPSGTQQEALALASVALPSSLDWRNYGGNYVTSIKDQGNCGSCWAFATTAALESRKVRANNMSGFDINQSEQVLISCGGAGNCNGGYIDFASNYIRDAGLPAESCYPYTATNGSCSSACPTYRTLTYNILSWGYIAKTVNDMKTALYNYGPVVTTMAVYSDFYSYTGGIYSYTSGGFVGNHAVLAIGYNDAGQYFIVKNSWGTGWGESGYFRIAYSQLSSVVNFGNQVIAYFIGPNLTVAPKSIGFGYVYTGTTSSAQTLTVSNSGDLNLKIGTITITGDNSSEFGKTVDYCSGQRLSPFGSCIVNVVFAPKSVGVKSAALSIPSDDSDQFDSNIGMTGTAIVQSPPPAPTNLTVTAVTPDQIVISWTDNSTNETGFKIERKTGAGGTYSQIATVGVNVTTYANTGLTENTTYYYRVKAFNAGGDSSYSNEVSATTPMSLPAAPTNLIAFAISTTQINLNWTDNATNEQGFKIERKIGAGGTYSQIATVGSNVTTYSNTGLAANTAYYYRVKAYNAAGDSTYSDEAYATTSCSNLPVRIAKATPVYYSSLQAAYNAAVNGDIIQSKAGTLTENLSINRNISVTLQGGYDCNFTTNSGSVTNLKGMMQTVTGGGTLTIGNFNVVQ